MDVQQNDNLSKNIKVEKYGKLVSSAGIASTITATLLIIIKVIALFITESATIMASLTDSIMDISASIINLIALRYAITPADEDHKYGHWKAEAIAGLAQCTFICGSAIFLMFHGISRTINTPTQIPNLDIAIIATIISVVLTALLISYQSYVVRKTNSLAINADRLHYLSDILFNAIVILSLGLSSYGILHADGIFAIVLGIYIFISSVKIFKNSINVLLDAELSPQDIANIQKIILSVDGVSGVHDIRTRSSGPWQFIQAHIEINQDFSLFKAHQITDWTEDKIKEQYPNADITLHMEPKE